MAGTPVILAVSAGMVAAANPCGFAMLPAYLSMLVADQDAPQSGPAEPGPVAASPGAAPSRVRGVRRALMSTVAMTAGFVAVFGVFGLVFAPVANWLQPRLPWVTLALGVLLALLGCWLIAGRVLPAAGPGGARGPRLTGSPGSMALFGVAYALASLSCTVAPFLAIVVSSLHAGSEAEALILFLGYAGGMGLVVGVTALAVALVRTSLVRRLRRASTAASRAGGVLLVAAGAYVAYYGWYELRIAADARVAGSDPVIAAAATAQQWLVRLIDRAGAEVLLGVFAGLLIAALSPRRPERAVPPPDVPPRTLPPAGPPRTVAAPAGPPRAVRSRTVPPQSRVVGERVAPTGSDGRFRRSIGGDRRHP